MNKMAEPITRKENVSEENFVFDDDVYILGSFDRSISENVIPAIVNLIGQKAGMKDPEINVYINSHGGFCEELWGLLTVLQMAKNSGIKIITNVIGLAYSCGSLLAVFGDVRKMSRFGDNVAHLGSAGFESSTFKQLDRQNDFIKKHFNKILDIYVEHTKVPRKKLEEMLNDDKLHLDAKTCLKLGFCDEII